MFSWSRRRRPGQSAPPLLRSRTCTPKLRRIGAPRGPGAGGALRAPQVLAQPAARASSPLSSSPSRPPATTPGPSDADAERSCSGGEPAFGSIPDKRGLGAPGSGALKPQPWGTPRARRCPGPRAGSGGRWRNGERPGPGPGPPTRPLLQRCERAGAGGLSERPRASSAPPPSWPAVGARTRVVGCSPALVCSRGSPPRVQVPGFQPP